VLAALIAGAVLVLGALAFGAVAVLTPTAQQPACESRFGTECSDIPLEQLERAFGVDLPEGTVVVSSEYTEFQDWRLTATFELPEAGFALPDGWDGAEPGVLRSAELDGTTLTLTAFTT
jgi:hypothetical protein